MLRATLRDVPESRPSCKARYYVNSGTKSSITNLHARSLPVRDSNPCYSLLKLLEFIERSPLVAG